MLRDQQAISYLLGVVDEEEKTRSVHWQEEFQLFEVDETGLASGANVLGNLSQKTSFFYRSAHWILQSPYRAMGRRFKSFPEDLKLGYMIAKRQDGRQFTLDILAQVLPLSLIRSHVSFNNNDVFNLVIGDGYGMMTSLLLLMPSARRTVVVNLTKSLVLDLVFARKSFPEVSIALVRDNNEMTKVVNDKSINIIAVQADNVDLLQLLPIGLAINIASMQEMEPVVIENYFDIMRFNPSEDTYFYCCNRLYKKLSDGTELEFQKYPWRAGDECLLDESCAWRNLTYNKIPPFWRNRKGHRKSWHRLVKLEKMPDGNA